MACGCWGFGVGCWFGWGLGLGQGVRFGVGFAERNGDSGF